MKFEIGQKIKIVIGIETNIGYVVLIEEQTEGLIYRNEIYSDVEEGTKTIGFVKKIREDGKVDVSLQPIGVRSTLEIDKEKIIKKLIDNQGVLFLSDKSSPESIKFHLKMSKKALKRALGSLYKERKVIISEREIRWSQ